MPTTQVNNLFILVHLLLYKLIILLHLDFLQVRILNLSWLLILLHLTILLLLLLLNHIQNLIQNTNPNNIQLNLQRLILHIVLHLQMLLTFNIPLQRQHQHQLLKFM